MWIYQEASPAVHVKIFSPDFVVSQVEVLEYFRSEWRMEINAMKISRCYFSAGFLEARLLLNGESGPGFGWKGNVHFQTLKKIPHNFSMLEVDQSPS